MTQPMKERMSAVEKDLQSDRPTVIWLSMELYSSLSPPPTGGHTIVWVRERRE